MKFLDKAAIANAELLRHYIPHRPHSTTTTRLDTGHSV